MRRTRPLSRSSSQDSPVTDNERDILWGDSPPARRVCLPTTPGRRITRSHAAEQDLADLIDCVHPKENKESNTPPLLGLWMKNRQEPGSSGKKRHRPTRPTRRTNGRKLSRTGLDKGVLNDLRILKEWTGNLTAAIEEASKHQEKVDGGGDREAEVLVEPERLPDPMDCDDVQLPEESGCKGARLEDGKPSSLNHSITDDLWGNDDWLDDDSIIRIATQVENEALTQQKQQQEHSDRRTSDEADVISPSQTLANSRMAGKTSGWGCQGPQQSCKTFSFNPQNLSTNSSSNTCRVITRNMSGNRSQVMNQMGKQHLHASSHPQKTIRRTSPTIQTLPFDAKRTAEKSVLKTSSANVKMSKQAPMMQKRDSHSLPNRPLCRSSPKPSSIVGNSAVPSIVDTTGQAKAASKEKPSIDDSLDDLFGDNSLPDDMLLALLDNDSDFEEYSKKATNPAPNGSNANKLSGVHVAPSTSTSSASLPTSATWTQTCNKTVPSSSVSWAASKHTSSGRGAVKHCAKSPPARQSTLAAGQPTGQPALRASSRATRSSVRLSSRLPEAVDQPAQQKQPAMSFSEMSCTESHNERRSLSQPVTPSAKKDHIHLQRFCSQQEIEQKRQAALAKRKQRHTKPFV
ncbi:uncharacterized protein [Diadema antillarum]|uniref:uncharacterized protein n=1 Tax=Diadema antillarum TaxID=105358 RepID=UPI003A84BE72